MQFALNSLRFEDVRQNIIDYLKENGRYTAEFDYDGSNLAYIIDSMAYANMLISYQLSLVANNMFLDTTEIRKNAVSIAKTLGYRPNRMQAANFRIRLKYTQQFYDRPLFNENSEIVIPSGTEFKGGDSGYSYINIDPIKLVYQSQTVLEVPEEQQAVLYQGQWRRYEVFGTGEPLQSFVLQSKGVEENNLYVSVKPSILGDESLVDWKEVSSFGDISQQEIFFVEEDIVNEGAPKILFGNGFIGKIPSQSETIVVEYLETKGSLGNGEQQILIPDNIQEILGEDLDAGNLEIILESTYSIGGTDHESLEEIKDKAPKYFTTAGRGVTASDYRTLLEYENDGTILSFNIVGGEELFPGRINELGKTYVTAVPVLEANFEDTQHIYLLENQEVNLIARLRPVGIISTMKTFMKPTYIWLDLQPYVEIESLTTFEEKNRIFQDVQDNMKRYFDEEFDSLGGDFRESNIQTVIDETPGVLSSDLTTNHGFVITESSMYTDRVSRMYLPTVIVKDSGGNWELDRNGIPITKNFVKTNKTAVEEYLDDYDPTSEPEYSIADFPPEMSTVYGTLFHPFVNRKMFTRDLLITPLVQWWLQKPTSEYTVVGYRSTTILGQDNVEYKITLRDDSGFVPGSLFTIMFEDLSGATIIDHEGNRSSSWPVAQISREVQSTGVVGEYEIVDQHAWALAINPFYEDKLKEVGLILNDDMVYMDIGQHGGEDQFPAETGVNGNAKIEYLEDFGSVVQRWALQLDGTVVAYINFNNDQSVLAWQVVTNAEDPDGVPGIIEEWGLTADSVQWFFDNWSTGDPADLVPTEIETNYDQYFTLDANLGGGMADVRLDGTTQIMKVKYIEADATLDPPTDGYFDIKDEQQWLIFANTDNNSVIMNVNAEPIEGTAPLAMFNLTSDIEFQDGSIKPNSTRQMGFQDKLIITEPDVDGYQTIYAYDIFHDLSIGFFNYFSGEIRFHETISGSYNISEPVTYTIRALFDNYTETKKFDVINMIPDNNIDSDTGSDIGDLIDFDASFNQFVVPDIQYPVTKKQ